MLKLVVASPCEEKWDTMRGDERVRHCERCKLNVFNVATLTEQQTLELLASNGRVCGRIFQRRDGTVLTKDCPVGLAKVRRRIVAGLAAAASLVLAAFSLRGPAACPSSLPGGGTFVDRMRSEVAHGEQWLRGTKTFGPIVEWIDPQISVMAGDIAIAPPPRPPAPPPGS